MELDMYGGDVMSRNKLILWVLGQPTKEMHKYSTMEDHVSIITDHMSMVCQVLAMKPDLILLENGTTSRVGQLKSDLGHMYHIVHFQANTVLGGFPAKGHIHRDHFVLVFKMKWSWTGSEDEFLRIFAEVPILDGDDLLCAPLEERRKFHLKLAANNGNVYAPDTPITQVPLHHCMTRMQQLAADKHKRNEDTLCNIKGTYIACVDKIGCPGGPWCPSITFNLGRLVSFSSEKFFTAKEYLAMMGEAVYPDLVGQGGECLFQHVLDHEDVSDNVIKGLAKGMHLHYLTPLMLYALACLKVSKYALAESASCE